MGSAGEGHRVEHPVLVCSARAEAAADLSARLAALGAQPTVAADESGWPADRPKLVVVDLADPGQRVRKIRARYGLETEVLALVDGSSLERLLPAIAAGCSDYLFFPVNPDELSLRWRRHVAGLGGDRPRRPGGLEADIALVFPSSVEHVRPAVDEIVDACERLAFAGSRATLNLRVALGEAIANAILYGNREDASRAVRVHATLAPGTAEVTVTDEGEGFDPSSVADPTLAENRGRSHGRGLFLLRTLADEVRYNERGNAVTLLVRASDG